MSLFNKEFYPTPPEVIRIMMQPYADKLPKARILEPSAGSGAILDYITETGFEQEIHGHKFNRTADVKNIYACEVNPELTMILQQKGYRVVADDFLSYKPDHRFDLVAMNPPFSSGAEHLLHAWEIISNGDIVCLLNAETILNPYTKTRKRLVTLIQTHGSTEELGPVFSKADNPTDVNVMMVRLHKEGKENDFNLNLEEFAKESMPDFGEMAAGTQSLEQTSRLDAFLRAWDLSKIAAKEFIKSFHRLRFYLSAFLSQDDKYPTNNVVGELYKQLTTSKPDNAGMQECYTGFLDNAKSAAWSVIFQQIGLRKYMTTSLQKKLDQFKDSQGSMELTKENINRLFSYIMMNIGDIMNNAVTEVYDLMTRYFPGNTSCDEGWKTNKRYKCNRKVILPNVAEAGYMPERYGYHEKFSVAYGAAERLNDIDKAMCWLTGTSFDEMEKSESPDSRTINHTLYTIKVGSQDWYESRFFRVKAFKKGTVHIEFKNEALWARFNQVVNKEKNMLGMEE